MELQALEQRFREIYGRAAEHAYFAPGRVNLIGEHTDYNGGRVFPCALSFGTYLLAAGRADGHTAFHSLNQAYSATTGAEAFKEKPGQWIRYPLGVMMEFADRGFSPGGYDLLYYGDIPSGAGLSSSASIEMVTAVMLNETTGAGLDMVELVKLSQHAENVFVGMNCGIMDQFASGMCRAGHAVALDCSTLAYEQVPLVMDGYKLLIANTNKQHKLTDGQYNERRSQCERAVEDIGRVRPLRFLCELTEEELAAYEKYIPDETVRRRARHAVSENRRVAHAVEALKRGDLQTFGTLMNASHRSLKEDYEVTGIELDTLAEAGQRQPGVLGSRMTGGGFGGCTVTLIREEAIEHFKAEVGGTYRERTGLEAAFYIAGIGDGARKIY